MRDFLVPMEQTARLCGMIYLAPFVAHGTHAMTVERMKEHAADYQRLLAAIRDDRLDVDAAASPELPFVNRALDAVLRED